MEKLLPRQTWSSGKIDDLLVYIDNIQYGEPGIFIVTCVRVNRDGDHIEPPVEFNSDQWAQFVDELMMSPIAECAVP